MRQCEEARHDTQEHTLHGSRMTICHIMAYRIRLKTSTDGVSSTCNVAGEKGLPEAGNAVTVVRRRSERLDA